MKEKIIMGVVMGLITGLIVGVIINNLIQEEPTYYDFTISSELDKIKASDFEEIEYTSQDCYEYFIDERISFIENPYNTNEWNCLIDSFGVYSLRNPSTNELSLFWYNPTCKCWKK